MTQPDLSAFGDFSIVRPLDSGHRNAAWMVVDRTGDKFVAKSTRHGEEALEWLEPLLRAAQRAGLQVPLLRRTGNGQLSCLGVTVEPFFEGRNPTAREMRNLAPHLREFHRNAIGTDQRPGLQAEPRLGKMVLFARTNIDSIPLPLRERCCDAMAAVQATRRQAIHGDLQPANLLLSGDGPTLIDWDEARVDYQFLDETCWRAPNEMERRAHLAIEIVNGWLVEPDYARRLASLI